MPLDLNQLRNTLKENARRGEANPDAARRQIIVDRDGRIHRGDELSSSERQEFSKVPQDLFAGLMDLFTRSERLERDREVVRDKLPACAKEVTVDGTTGFVYSIIDEFGELYIFVVYFDGEYQIKVVEPEIEDEYGVENAHIFGDGRLCLRPPANGMARLEDAYAKSVLWASGFTVLRRTGEFPWPQH